MSNTGSSDGNKFSNKFGYAPPIKVYESAFAQAKVSVCLVQAPPVSPDTIATQGTAALYELADGVFTAATNNHVLSFTDSDLLVRVIFTFEGLGPIKLNKDDIKCCTTSKELDATVIELTDACVKRLEQLGAQFIRLTTAREGDKIAIPHYIEGELSFDTGVINEIKDKELHYYSYYSVDASASSGSPIVLWNFWAIGMHTQSDTCIEHRALGPVRRGTSLLAIAVFHLAASRSSGATTSPVRPLSLSSASRMQLVRRISNQMLIRNGEIDPYISWISYNSARDELFFVDDSHHVVRTMRLRDNAGDLRDVYRAPHDTCPQIWNVCHMSDLDTLLVCSCESGADQKIAYWLVALSRNGSEWRETQRLQTEEDAQSICALSDSRVLIGVADLPRRQYMELFRVESGPRIARVHRIHVPERYDSFSATCDSNTLVAMTYPDPDKSVRINRLLGDRLEELARIMMNNPIELLWVADRLIVSDFDENNESDAVILLELNGTRRELISTSENIDTYSWCAVNDGIVIFDLNSADILHYSFASK